jgi:hypothetical protein
MPASHVLRALGKQKKIAAGTLRPTIRTQDDWPVPQELQEAGWYFTRKKVSTKSRKTASKNLLVKLTAEGEAVGCIPLKHGADMAELVATWKKEQDEQKAKAEKKEMQQKRYDAMNAKLVKMRRLRATACKSEPECEPDVRKRLAAATADCPTKTCRMRAASPTMRMMMTTMRRRIPLMRKRKTLENCWQALWTT